MGRHHLGQLGPALHRLSNAQCHIATTIYWHVPDHSEYLTAGIPTIARWADRSTRTVQAMMPILVELGMIQVVEPARPGVAGVYRLLNFAADSSGKNTGDPTGNGTGDPSGASTRPHGSTAPTSRVDYSNSTDDSLQGTRQGITKEPAASQSEDPRPEDFPDQWEEAVADAIKKGANYPKRYAVARFRENVAALVDRQQREKRSADVERAIAECSTCYSTGWRDGPDGMVRCGHSAADAAAASRLDNSMKLNSVEPSVEYEVHRGSGQDAPPIGQGTNAAPPQDGGIRSKQRDRREEPAWHQ